MNIHGKDRAIIAATYRARGLKYREIAVVLGRDDDQSTPISVERARQLAARGHRMFRHPQMRRYFEGDSI